MRELFPLMCIMCELIPSQDLKKPPKITKLTTIGMYGFSRGDWPRMTFERSRCNAKGQMWSSSDLNHAKYLHSCQWRQVTWLKTRFPWKVGRRLYLLWRHSSLTWPDLAQSISSPKVAQKMLISYAKFRSDTPCGSAAIPKYPWELHPPLYGRGYVSRHTSFHFVESISPTQTQDQDHKQDHAKQCRRTDLNNDARYKPANVWHLVYCYVW